MMLTIFILLALTAFLSTIAAAMGKCPLWLPVLLLSLIELLRALPLGR